MAIDAKFTRTLPAPSATISSGFVFLLSAGWFTDADLGAAGDPIGGGANSIANGGGDMQIFSDTATTTRLPIEVVSFVTGGTPEAQVWVRTPSYTSGDTITVGRDDTQTVQPAVGAAFGRDAVWVDFEIVSHDLVTDSTGNYSNPFTVSGNPVVIDGPFNNSSGGYEFDGTGDQITVDLDGRNPMDSLAAADTLTIQAWLSNSSTDPDNRGVSIHGGSSWAQLGQNVSSGDTSSNSYISGSSNTNARRGVSIAKSSDNSYSLITGELVLSAGAVSSTITATAYNGTTSSTTNSVGSLGDGDNTASIVFGGRNDGVGDYFGKISEVRFKKDGTSSDVVDSEESNQSDPDNFGTSSEWILVGGGGRIMGSLVYLGGLTGSGGLTGRGGGLVG